jgi:hypothetical protein
MSFILNAVEINMLSSFVTEVVASVFFKIDYCLFKMNNNKENKDNEKIKDLTIIKKEGRFTLEKIEYMQTIEELNKTIKENNYKEKRLL